MMNLPIIKYLIKKGGNINDTYLNATLLDIVLSNNHYEIDLDILLSNIEYFLELGIKNNIKEIYNNIDILKILVNHDVINNFIIDKNINNLLKERYNVICNNFYFKENNLNNIIINYIT